MNEIWKAVPGYVGCYKVSDQGRVRSLCREILCGPGRKGTRILPARILKQFKSKEGYFRVCLHKDQCHKTIETHRLVCWAFLGPRQEGMEVLHGSGGKEDNRLVNLKYGTSSENARDRMRDGTQFALEVRRSDGVIFLSMAAAARESGTFIQNVAAACHGKLKSAGGFQWELTGEYNGRHPSRGSLRTRRRAPP